MYGPEMREDLLADLQALPEDWVWLKPYQGPIVQPGRASNGALMACVIALAYDPKQPKLRKAFQFNDEDLEPFRETAKLCGYPSVEHALSHFLETNAFRRKEQCQALP